MCITLPAKVISSDGRVAEIDNNGRRQSVRVGTSERLLPGDWVLTTADYLIKKIDELEAQEIYSLLENYTDIDRDNISQELKDILSARQQRDLTKEEIVYLLSLDDKISLQALYSEANIIRKSTIKDHICVHGIIEFSNHCKNNCLYCGLRRDNNEKITYRMEPEEIITTAVQAVNDRGYKLLVLQSGEDNFYDERKLLDIVSGIKTQCRVFLYLSIGDREAELYKKLKQAGANGVLMRFESANPEIYAKMHNGEALADKLNLIKELKRLGYVISTGPIIGLPGQTAEDLADDILTMKDIGLFMPSMGPLVPSANTPLLNERVIDSNMILKVIAATRLAVPTARIPVTTAMETLYGMEFRQQAFLAGANSVMLNLTPEKYRDSYYIYANKFFDQEKKYEKWALFKGELSYQMLEEELQMSI